ncbi:hypothetical protein N9980_01390 [bacterium]|nr:hypothetical protein [bacterium]
MRRSRERWTDNVVVDILIPGSPQAYFDQTNKGLEEMADMPINSRFNVVSLRAAITEVI